MQRQRANRTLQAQPDGEPGAAAEASIDCGWGDLIMAHTYREPARLAAALLRESPGQRHLAFYVRDPHVVLAEAPESLFLDPSHSFRLWLTDYQSAHSRRRGFSVRRLRTRADAGAINRLYASCGMVESPAAAIWKARASRRLSYIIAEDRDSGAIIGTAMGVDHVNAFDDPSGGCSLWCVAVDPQARHPGIGEALVRYLIEHFQARGREYLDLSVMHANRGAIGLYEKLGFQRVPVFCVKRRNAINAPLFTGAGPGGFDGLNPYAMLIVREALRRGVAVQVLDAEGGYFRLRWGGRQVTCRESLSELTSAVAMSRCQDKRTTHRVLAAEGLRVPAQRLADSGDEIGAGDRAFLAAHGALVAKPADGEQGEGVAVDLRDAESLAAAVADARRFDSRVLLEACCPGEDLRVVVIGYEMVAAALRRPPAVIGDGHSRLRELIEAQSRRRAAATGGESRIPLDAETERCLAAAGHSLDQVPAAGAQIRVRRTANLHTGGTIHDVTDELHPALAEAAVRAARALEIPVVGVDMMVPAVDASDYVIIEANERPGLANHEPQPTAERFLDLLFPQTAAEAAAGDDTPQVKP